MDALRLLFPGDTVSLFEQTVEDLLSQTQGALLSVGFILSLYYASSSVHAVLSDSTRVRCWSKRATLGSSGCGPCSC